MSNLAQIAEQITGISDDLKALEKTLAQSERERREYEASPERIHELVREGQLLANKYKCDYAVVRDLMSGGFVLVGAAASNKKTWLAHIRCRSLKGVEF